jgi:thymidylate synthase
MIRDNKLISHYLMRSNDCVFGYTADVHWALHVQKMLAQRLLVEVGDLIWTATNLHAYERHFLHIEKMIETEK